ncbi:MAG TPA: acyltransferase, partial [Chitinophagaceae bacterium]|nr:acyltransferase [Chitinophagaceae bacterium]
MNKTTHFGGLDGLRFISISFVVLHHLLTFINYYGFHRFEYPLVGLIGYYGIQFFFAGSGFLITYLLLKEHKKNGKIDLKYFYLRRILRIWPAYYVLIIVALIICLQLPFFEIPELTGQYLAGNYHRSNLLYFFVLPHLEPFYNSTAPYVHQTYTIGIEEQFYFLWGLLFFLAARFARQIFWIIIIVMPILLFSHETLFTQPDGHAPVIRYFLKIVTYLKYCRFSTFAIGGLFAYAFFHGARWINFFRSPAAQVAVYLLLIVSLAFDISIPYFRDEYIALLMLCLFTVATFGKQSLVNYDARWL